MITTDVASIMLEFGMFVLTMVTVVILLIERKK